VNEKVEIIYAVSPILLVIEVDPEPGASLAIEDIKRSRLWIGLNRYEQQNRRWKFNPAHGLSVLGDSEQSSDRGFSRDRRYRENRLCLHMTEHRFSFLASDRRPANTGGLRTDAKWLVFWGSANFNEIV
jgi:hypothetical protein